MEYKSFKKDFVKRTIMIIESASNCQYEVTLLVNCLMGLVGLPTEKTSQTDAKFIKTCVTELHRIHAVTKDSGDDQKTFRALRNAVAHMRISMSNEGGKIDSIQFCDTASKAANSHTELSFTVQQLKDYALFVANAYLKRFGKED